MKKIVKLLTIVLVIVAISALAFGLVACNNDNYDTTFRFTAPQGTPALAMLRLVTDNPTINGNKMEYEVVTPKLIAGEMTDGKSDILIMPINAGAKLINAGKNYKLVSVAVDGSLFMVGKKEGSNNLTIDDVKGKKVACIGQNNVPGLTFEYVLKNNGLEVIYDGEPSENQVFIQYVNDATDARAEYANGNVSYLVVGEPAGTMFKGLLSLNAEMDIQAQYSLINPAANGENYPQAGLFVRASLANDTAFMNALFDALSASKEWVIAHPSEVNGFAKQNLYESANFPAGSIDRCAINCSRINQAEQDRIVTFLKYIVGNIDWEGAREKLF